MDPQIHHLLLEPFQELVAKARISLENAKEADDDGDNVPEMRRAAKGLLGKGERAVKRLEPLCQRLMGEYGDAFVDAVRENDDISSLREELNGLLWDLDDYLDVESFDGEIYANLSDALRRAALKSSEALVRMKLEKRTAALPTSGVVEPPPPLPTRDGNEQMTMQANAGPVQSWDEGNESVNSRADGSAAGVPCAVIQPEDVPSEPATDPWSPEKLSEYTWKEAVDDTDETTQRRPAVPSEADDELVSPLTPGTETNPALYRRGRLDEGVKRSLQEQVEREEEGHASSGGPASPAVLVSAPTMPTTVRSGSDSTLSRTSTQSPSSPHAKTLPRLLTPTAPRSRTGSAASQPKSFLMGALLPGVAALAIAHPRREVEEDGLIPVDAESSSLGAARGDYFRECVIDSTSSFELAGGLCEGAREALRGNQNIRSIFNSVANTKPSSRAGPRNDIECLHCSFGLISKDLAADLSGHASAIFSTPHGIHYRPRFLVKCHLRRPPAASSIFACPFCLDIGSTLTHNDATVFLSSSDLMEHIARHPRPLPTIEGIIVADHSGNDTPLSPSQVPAEFDLLLFGSSPAAVSVDPPFGPGGAAAVATRWYRMTSQGMRVPPDRAPEIQFAAGQKICEVEFPPVYEGMWAVGWANGKRGAFPTDCIRLVPPLRVAEPGTLGAGKGKGEVKVRMRWDFDGQGEGGWLRLAKGDVVRAVTYVDADDWCWAGWDREGNWGLFPRAFVDPKSIPAGEAAGGETPRRSFSGWEKAVKRFVDRPPIGVGPVARGKGVRPSLY